MIKFVWCLGHHGSGRVRRSNEFQPSYRGTEWECIDCGAIMVKTGIELDQEKNWRLVQEVIDDSN